MAASLPLQFVRSASQVDQLPESPAELTVVGRSNVGKSSLLNALAGRRRDLARVSKTPGRTQLLNVFETDGGATVVDCPGYGWASASKADRAAWMDLVEQYLLEREELAMVLVLVDGEVGPTPLDLDMLSWLREEALPHTVVATKHDKVKSAKREKRKRELAERCMLERGDIVWVSARTGVGLDRLRGLARLWLGLPGAP